MTKDVSWPKASEGGKVVGKEEIRGYWTRQWGEFDPHVEPLAMTEEDGGKTRVRVHQLAKSLQGDVLPDSEGLQVFTVNSGLIAAMDLWDETDPTAWFVCRIRTPILTGYPRRVRVGSSLENSVNGRQTTFSAQPDRSR
jgi:hypothetical protein